MRPAQFADWLGVRLSKVYQLIKAGEVEVFHIGRATLITGESALALRERLLTAEQAVREPDQAA